MTLDLYKVVILEQIKNEYFYTEKRVHRVD